MYGRVWSMLILFIQSETVFNALANKLIVE